MTIYIVSFTSYSEYDNYLHTERKVFNDYDKAQKYFQELDNAAVGNITYDDEIPFYEITSSRSKNRSVFTRRENFQKIIVELTEQEL